MGCFSMSCAVSGLPIDGGDAVRVSLVTKNPYELGALACEIDGLWVPRTWPVRGTYDDYGGADVDESTVAATWQAGLAYDAPEFVDTMATSGLIAAAREGRLSVRRSSDPSSRAVVHAEAYAARAIDPHVQEMIDAIEARRAEDAKGPRLTVAPMMIREDVWRSIVADGASMWGESVSRRAFREAAGRAWEKLLSWGDSILRGGDARDPFGWAFRISNVPDVLGLDVSFALVARAFKEGKVSPAEAEAFLDDAADFAFLRYALIAVRHLWRPSYAAGPQSGDWRAHERFLATMHRLARERAEAET